MEAAAGARLYIQTVSLKRRSLKNKCVFLRVIVVLSVLSHQKEVEAFLRQAES